MRAFLKILYVIYSPVLVILYWRNTMKNLEDIQDFTLYQNQNTDLDTAQV